MHTGTTKARPSSAFPGSSRLTNTFAASTLPSSSLHNSNAAGRLNRWGGSGIGVTRRRSAASYSDASWRLPSDAARSHLCVGWRRACLRAARIRASAMSWHKSAGLLGADTMRAPTPYYLYHFFSSGTWGLAYRYGKVICFQPPLTELFLTQMNKLIFRQHVQVLTRLPTLFL